MIRIMKRGRKKKKDIDVEKDKVWLSCCPTFPTTGANTNPFNSKQGKVLGGEKKTMEKDTLQQLLGKLWVSVLVLSAVHLDPVLWGFLVLRLVSEVFKVVNTLYVAEGIDVWKLLLNIFWKQ